MDAPIPMESVVPDAEVRRRAGNSRGGRNRVMKNRPHLQAHGSLETPNGRSWLQLKADYESGVFSVMDLHKLYGVPRQTINYRARNDGWVMSTAPTIAKNLPGLVELLDGARDEDTVEAATAAIEGRPVDVAMLVKEKAQHGAARKARVIHDHREFAHRYRNLFTKAADFLDMYSNGRMPYAFILTKAMVDGKEKEIILNFSLFSRQTGFIDAVDKVGSILERLIKVERSTHGIEEFDGDGRKRGSALGGADASSTFRNYTTDELTAQLANLTIALQSENRRASCA